MSIIWFNDNLIETENLNSQEPSCSCAIMIFANTISVLMAAAYILFYKSNKKIHNSQSNFSFNFLDNITTIKILTEGIISFHLLFLLAGTHSSKASAKESELNFLVKLTVTTSPSIIIVHSYLNSCIAHNIYVTYYDHRKTYNKRLIFYKLSSYFLFFMTYLITIFNTDFSNNMYSNLYYSIKFVNLFYCIQLGMILYIIHNFYYINLIENQYVTLDNDDPKDLAIRKLVNSLVKRNLIHMSYYIIAYLPNNLVFLITYFFDFSLNNNFYFIYIVMLLISFNCCFTIIVELMDPFMRKYLQTYLFSVRRNSRNCQHRDSYENIDNLLHPLNEQGDEKVEMEEILSICTPEKQTSGLSDNSSMKKTPNTFNSSDERDDRCSIKSIRSDDISNKNHHSHRKIRSKNSFFYLSHGARTFELMNCHLEYSDSIQRMIGISILINEDRVYDKDNLIKIKFQSPLPWAEEEIYNMKTTFQEYRQSNLPDWVNIKYEKKFQFLKIKIKKYCAMVFHHIRVTDKISVDDCISSLDPILNLKMIKDSKVSGGRSPNSILFTWDKKMLIKTISKKEKQLLLKELLKQYHVRMRDTKSLLCRIYGLFRIKISDNIDTYVVLMKNMIDLPLETKILTFDLKGSTADRECILEHDKQRDRNDIIKDYKDQILKDKDLTFLQVEFNLSSSDAMNLVTAIEKDSLFLEKYWITDYSLLASLHKFRVEDYRNNFKNLRVLKSSDDKFLFCFSIIDFLTTYNYEKKGEKITKNFVSMMKRTKDKNISAEEPKRYGLRFRTFIKSLINIMGESVGIK